ncbi:MAG: polysaccharide pyruvyl transferase family protein [Rhizobiales bacterium]|nr:polysaccharide pyruvyl transferase family protein [Hyphomicrobiales bacterium]
MRSQQSLALIARMQGMIDDCLRDCLVDDAPLAILDFPDIRNCGDSAIWLGEMAYLASRGKRPAYVSRMRDFSAEALERAVPEGPIFIHGGGNFGDLWVSHQDFREAVLERFPHRRIIQFPQSIHYRSEERIAQTARAIARHRNFLLLVRDQESKDFAERHFDCEVRLCPDMAFWIGAVEPGAVEFPVLAMLRADLEKTGEVDRSAYPGLPIEDWITESARRVRVSKAAGAALAFLALKPAEMRLRKLDAAAHNRFRRGIRQISRGRTVVTDRLHVHICSLLIGRPHAVLDNSYGKIGRFMAAFSGGTELAYRASSLDDGLEWAFGQISPAIAA